MERDSNNLQLFVHPLSLQLQHPFTISRGTLNSQETLIVELRGEGFSGWGEVTPNRYYQKNIDSLKRSFDLARELLPQYQTQSPEVVWPKAMELLADTFSVSALDMAAHDWHARRRGLPTWKVWELVSEPIPASSYTIAIDSLEKMITKLNEQPNWPIYKIKLGTDQDIELVRAIRSATHARLRVDANCAWTVDQTIDYSSELEELGVEFIEQPLPADAPPDQHREVYERSRLPIIADESCQVEPDVESCHRLFHGINIKLCKCGGLTPALRMLRRAKSLGMSTMVGCMIESSIGISAAAQLLPLLDYADLDGSALLKEDPTQGIQVISGVIRLNEHPGHGSFLPPAYQAGVGQHG